MEYKTIAEASSASFIVKKSEFIGYVSPVETDEEARSFIAQIRAANRKATHNCYAYILRHNNISRYSDDGEPAGTAGIPIFEVLTKMGLTDIACVVTRYFGGIMLGAGGLVRAYGNGASIAVDAAKIKVMALAEKLRVTVDYPLYGIIGGLLNSPQYGIRITDEIFSDKVDIELYIREAFAESFTSELIDLCNGNVIIEKYEKSYYDFR